MARVDTLSNIVAVGSRIRGLRVELGLSQREVAVPGVSYAYVSRIEAGMRTPSIGALVSLAACFREAAQAQLDNLLPLVSDDDAVFVAYVERLQWVVEHVHALYLLTGDHRQPCLVCGRHEHEGAHTNGQSNGSTRR